MGGSTLHRAEELPVFLEALKPGVGLVIGSRVVGGSEEYHHVRALGNVFLSATLGVCTRQYLSDALNGYKVHRLTHRHITGRSTMYIGPDAIMPLASAVAAVTGFVLMFWRRFVGLVRGTFSAVRRRISSNHSK